MTSAKAQRSISFVDPARFHRSVAQGVAAGVAGGLLAWLGSTLSGSTVPALPLVTAAVAVSLALGRAWPWILLSAVAGAAAGLLPWLLSNHQPVALMFAGAMLGAITAGRPIPEGPARGPLLAALGCALSLPAGYLALDVLMSHGWLESALPGPLPGAVHGGLLGLYAVLGVAAAHVTSSRDLTDQAFAQARPILEGDLLALAERGHAAYHAARHLVELRTTDREAAVVMRRQLGDVARRVIGLARECQTVERDLGPDAEARLAGELEKLDARIAACDDEVAARQYLLARRTLESQLEQVQRIRLGRERAVAAIHGQLAILERTRLSLVALRSSDSNRLAAELQGVSDVLSDAAREMEAESEAVLELTGGGPVI